MTEIGDFQGFTKEQVNSFREAFNIFDQNGNGSITSAELGTVMRDLGQNPSQQEIDEMVLEIDADGNDNIEFEEFLLMMENKVRSVIPEPTLREAFQVFDKDGNGFISLDELRHVMHCFNAPLTLREAQQMMTEADLDKDGQLNFKEFSYVINAA